MRKIELTVEPKNSLLPEHTTAFQSGCFGSRYVAFYMRQVRWKSHTGAAVKILSTWVAAYVSKASHQELYALQMVLHNTIAEWNCCDFNIILHPSPFLSPVHDYQNYRARDLLWRLRLIGSFIELEQRRSRLVVSNECPPWKTDRRQSPTLIITSSRSVINRAFVSFVRKARHVALPTVAVGLQKF